MSAYDISKKPTAERLFRERVEAKLLAQELLLASLVVTMKPDVRQVVAKILEEKISFYADKSFSRSRRNAIRTELERTIRDLRFGIPAEAKTEDS